MPRFNLPLFEHKIVPVATGLLRQDKQFLSLFYPLLVLPSLFGQYVDSPDTKFLLTLKILERLAQLMMVALVGSRALASVSAKGRKQPSISGVARVVMLGFLVWLLLNIPLASTALASAGAMNHQQIMIFALLLAIPASAVVYLHFYYFFSGVFGRLGLNGVLSFARILLKRDPLLPVLVLLGPLAITYVLQALLGLFSPDGRLFWVSQVLALVAPLSWVLSSYLGVGAGLLLLSENEWREFELDPYRESRLSTLAIQGQSPLNVLMLPKFALPALVMGVLLGVGNLMRMLGQPPAPTISVEKIEVVGTHATLTLALEDDKYLFRGFQPAHFRLAGAEGKVVSLHPVNAILPETGAGVLLAFPHDEPKRTLKVEFVTDREANDLQRLEDLHLWYGNSKLLLLDMSKAVMGASIEAPEPNSTAPALPP